MTVGLSRRRAIAAMAGAGAVAVVGVATKTWASHHSVAVPSRVQRVLAQLNPPPSSIRVQIDASQPLRWISPLIYGVAAGGADELAATGASFNRWGGNPNTRYNWVLGNAWNTARDWQFNNYGWNDGPPSQTRRLECGGRLRQTESVKRRRQPDHRARDRLGGARRTGRLAFERGAGPRWAADGRTRRRDRRLRPDRQSRAHQRSIHGPQRQHLRGSARPGLAYRLPGRVGGPPRAPFRQRERSGRQVLRDRQRARPVVGDPHGHRPRPAGVPGSGERPSWITPVR